MGRPLKGVLQGVAWSGYLRSLALALAGVCTGLGQRQTQARWLPWMGVKGYGDTARVVRQEWSGHSVKKAEGTGLSLHQDEGQGNIKDDSPLGWGSSTQTHFPINYILVTTGAKCKGIRVEVRIRFHWVLSEVVSLSLRNISHFHVFTCLIHTVTFLIVP